ncbi:hypothetical protein Tco_0531568 [Tanacetum coccineum]
MNDVGRSMMQTQGDWVKIDQVSSHPVFEPLTGCDRLVSRAKADGAQSPRVPIPFPEDPYEAIRQAYLVETETPESPHTVASPTLLLDNTPPTRHAEDSVDSDTSGARPMSSDFTAPLSANHPLTHTTPTMVPLFHMIARMAVCVPPTMSPGLSASITKVAAISNPAFHKRFGSSYESSPSSSPADLPLRKHFRGTFDLVGVYKEEDNDEEEDEEIEESSDSDSESKGAEDRGGDATVPEGQQRGALVVETAVGEPLGLGYGALRRREIALEEGQMPSIFEVGQTDAHRAALWHAISDMQMENRELRLQIAEERRARLDLVKIVDSIMRGQEPRGDV